MPKILPKEVILSNGTVDCSGKLSGATWTKDIYADEKALN
jgi:hypothetical protein